jgi:mitogen-activated protein kinase 15
LIRFHNASEEIVKGYDVVPQLSDDIQLTVDEYRKKLYEVKSKFSNKSYYLSI